MTSAPPLPRLVVDARARRRRRTIAVVLLVGILALAVGLTIAVGRTIVVPAFVIEPGADDGVIDASASAAISDTDLPAIARLDPALRAAVTAAESAAAGEGVTFEIMSGWRSRAYQERLFADAVETYGSTEVAAQYVAAPDRSRHVSGEAVDIGGVDAQFWLIARGAEWGLCQIYANERWHFELATTPGGTCPALRDDASG